MFLLFSKISQYSPSEGNKIYDKAVQRKTTPIFNPKGILEIIKQQHKPGELLSSSEKEELITRYLTVNIFFKKKMFLTNKTNFYFILVQTINVKTGSR